MSTHTLISKTLFEGAGDAWSDLIPYQALDNESKYKFPSKIIIDYVEFVDRIQFIYSDKELPFHGGGARKKMEICLDSDEYIEGVICDYCKFGASKYMICTLLFKTNKKEVGFTSFHQPNDKTRVEYTFPKGFALSFIAGRTDHYNTSKEPCVAGLKLFASQIKEEAMVYGVLNDDLKYLRAISNMELEQDVDYCFEINTNDNSQIACAFIKEVVGEVTFCVTGKNGTPLENGGDETSLVSSDDNLTTFILNNPVTEGWLLNISAKKGSRFNMGALVLSKDIEPKRIEWYGNKWLPYISDRFFTASDIVMPVTYATQELTLRLMNTSVQQNKTSRSVAALPIATLHMINVCSAFTPMVTFSIVCVLGASYVVYKMVNASNNNESLIDLRNAVMAKLTDTFADDYNDKKFWEWSPSCDAYQELGDWKNEDLPTYDNRTKTLYDNIYNHFNKDINIANIPASQYIDSTFLQSNNYILNVDVGGEGYMTDWGTTFGFTDAISLNGRRYHSSYKQNIPMLLHVSDWSKDKFPFADGVVTRFTVQGITSKLTKNQADEIVRCLNKTSGVIKFYLNQKGGTMVSILVYIAMQLKCKISENYKKGSYIYSINVKNTVNEQEGL